MTKTIDVAIFGAAGCGGSIHEAGVGGVASYERGREAFDRKDYMDAIADLKAYVEQFPGTENTDDALYYLGESYFGIKDYALAAGQYDRLTRDFPASPFQPDALVQLAADPLPDLVLLDVMIPHVTGFAVLEKLRSEPRTRALPVVMMTSFSRERDVAHGRELGANDYIVKPLMELDFLDRVARALGEHRAG